MLKVRTWTSLGGPDILFLQKIHRILSFFLGKALLEPSTQDSQGHVEIHFHNKNGEWNENIDDQICA